MNECYSNWEELITLCYANSSMVDADGQNVKYEYRRSKILHSASYSH